MRSPHPAAVIFKSVASRGIGDKGGRLSGRPPFVCPGGCRAPRPAPRPRCPLFAGCPLSPGYPLSADYPFPCDQAFSRFSGRLLCGQPAVPLLALPRPPSPSRLFRRVSVPTYRALSRRASVPRPAFPLGVPVPTCPAASLLSDACPASGLSAPSLLPGTYPSSGPLPPSRRTPAPPACALGGGGDKREGRAEREVNTPYFPGNKALKSLPAGRGRPRGYRKAAAGCEPGGWGRRWGRPPWALNGGLEIGVFGEMSESPRGHRWQSPSRAADKRGAGLRDFEKDAVRPTRA